MQPQKMHSPAMDLPAQQSEMTLGLRIKFLNELVATVLEEIQGLATVHTPSLDQGFNFYEEVRRYEIDLIQRALKYTGGRQSKAARLLGLKATTLNSKLKHYGIPIKESSESPAHAFLTAQTENHSRRPILNDNGNIGIEVSTR